MDPKPVFFDPTQRRAARLRALFGLLALVAAGLLSVFWASVLYVPVARLALRRPRFLPDNPPRPEKNAQPNRNTASGAAPLPSVRAEGPIPGRAANVVGAFYVDWDETSLASLKEHATRLTHLFPGWLHLNADGSGLIVRDSDPADEETRQIARQSGLAVVPLVNNYSDQGRDFDEARLHALLTHPERRRKVAEQLAEYVRRHRFAGINLDLETEDEDDRERLVSFTHEVSALLRPQGLLVTACTQVGEPRQAAAVARWCDFVIPMLYDQHWAGGEPGPIAPDAWFRGELDHFLAAVPADKCVLAIGNYAYDWVKGKAGARTLTVGEALATAEESRDDDDGIVQFDPASRNPTFTYDEDDGKHVVWMLDGPVGYNFLRYARTKGVTGRALWYLGSEDPGLWSVFGAGETPTDPARMEWVRYGLEIDFEGDGEVLDLIAQPKPGHRTFTRADDGYLANETFLTYPTQCIVRRSGKAEKLVALTFDDGPDPTWTPAVLDALKAARIPATFFVCGVNVEQYPDLVARAFREGHDIGNHSFYHPNLARVSETRTRLELGATLRAIEASLGRSTTLFRPPYGIDTQPRTFAEVLPIDTAHRLGYVTVAEGIDPRDWESGARRRTAAELADQIVAEAEAGAHGDARWKGNIVLLHDSGGDRSATAAAVPLAVARLQAKGYRFVTVSQLIGLSRDAAFPPLKGQQKWIARIDGLVFRVSAWGGRLIAAVFLFSLVAGTLRLIATGTLAVRHARLPEPTVPDGFAPRVSVLIAAYNEAPVIARTIDALLASRYPNLEVLVVDDGSKDGTADVVKERFAGDARVRLLVQPNSGKATALNRAIQQANGEILVGLDADTLFAPDAVARLVRWFADPSVTAVAGNILVGNRINLWTRFQALEYATSQNFDRRAAACLNAIAVVPGCIGAWRADAVRAAGGYLTDTLAEDADLTWRVRKLGGRVVCDNTALSYTEAPERLRDLLKQRFRWTFGTLQVMYKHRDVLFRPRYGAFGMVVAPLLWVFQLLLPALAPVADAGVLLAALQGNAQLAAWFALFFFLTELAGAALALRLDDATPERRRDLWLLALQRLVFRYLLLAVLIRSLSAALQGVRAVWGKLPRSGKATAS